ncbi:DUF2470 domain-containing protein [Pseudomonas alcaligenes]|uniref:HugZ family pyridoxamine 5'-phosphate oxidase n=1 Tax=Pseudomonas sp. RIT-PI-AD TaxID=3035294 RepID=UPI0021D985DF
MSDKAAQHARELLLKEYQGVLSTHSKAMPGFPFGSVVPYCLDGAGRPLILISRIAQHTHNLQKDSKCSLLVGERGADDVQAAGRLTLLAEARVLDEADTAAAAAHYYRYFPHARDYHLTHDFDFWVLEPVRGRYIGGFGEIHWINQLALVNPFFGERGSSMLEHMNADHAKAIAHYVELAGLSGEGAAEMVGLDSEGFHLRLGRTLHWLPFPRPCGDPGAVRQALVELAHATQWPAREA